MRPDYANTEQMLAAIKRPAATHFKGVGRRNFSRQFIGVVGALRLECTVLRPHQAAVAARSRRSKFARH